MSPRYVKSLEELMRVAQERASAGPMETEAQGLTIEYATDPELARALVPPPLTANDEGRLQMTFAKAIMRPAPDVQIEIGAFTFGVHITYEGRPGLYPVTMVFDDELTVISGREMWGEPKKIGRVDFSVQGDTARAAVIRHGIAFASFTGTLGDALEPAEQTEHSYCFKFTLAADASGFDHDPQLIRLIWNRKQLEARALAGELTLLDSAFDPVADLPVRRLLGASWARTLTRSGGENVCTVPALSLFPFMQQRYDDIAAYCSRK